MDFKRFIESHEGHYVSVPAEIPLPQDVYLLSDLFSKHGASLFAVGGAVRDYLYHLIHQQGQGYAPKDVDLATEASPEKVVEILSSSLARSHGVKVFPKGAAFGVISAIVNGTEYEIATFREEWYDPETGDGRRPDKVSFSTPAQDAQRRDLTMNALFYDIHAKEIRDYNVNAQGEGQGIEDIRNLVARPVGNARDRFREDKLRIPRLIRFFSKYNPGQIMQHMDRETAAAIEEFKHLSGVSPERISNEFLTGLAKSANPVNYLRNYQLTGLLPAVFPGLNVDVDGIDRIGNIRNPKAVLAWLLRNNGDPRNIRQRLNQLTYSNDMADGVMFLVKLLHFDPAQIAGFLRQRDIHKQIKDPVAQQVAAGTMTRDVMDFAKITGMEKELQHFLNYQPVARAQDFAHLKGKAIGDAMSAAEVEAYRRSLLNN